MAEDDAEKTEEPTERKLSRAREEGQTATSQEIKSWGILAAGTFMLLWIGPVVISGLREALRVFVEQAAQIPSDFQHMHRMFLNIGLDVLMITWPVFLTLMLVAVAFNIVQSGLMWSPKRVEPKLQNLSPIAGFKRLFSLKSVLEVVKGIFKIGLVVGIGAIFVIPALADLELLPGMSVSQQLGRIEVIALRMLGATVAVTAVIALIDYAYQKWSFRKGLRMSKSEVKDEHKQTEGDPQVKAKIRQLRVKRAQERMMAAVPKADVVVTNPTHYAVAMRYDMETMPAPMLIAKGADEVALRIREVAERHDVPIVENPPLAQALFATVEIDEEIPQEHYKAVAEVIGYVMRLRGEIPASPAGGEAAR